MKTEAKNCVYALRHNPTGKIYIGCSKNVERRVHQHITQLLSGIHPVETLQTDFDTFGNSFSYFVLFEAFASYDAFQMEKHFMSLLGTRDPAKGYNYRDNSNEFSLSHFREHKVKGYKNMPSRQEGEIV